MPKHLTIELSRRGIEYLPCVGIGQAVAPGDALARVEMHGGVTMLPSPASGRVVEVGEAGSQIKIDTEPTDSDRPSIEPLKPQYATSGLVREAIGRGGLWPVFWSSATENMPIIDGSEIPKRVIVNFVVAEPFHARGRVVLTRSWSDVMEGIRFLPRLLDDYGKVEIILTAVRDPVARKMYQELAGYAWTRLHPVPVRYPVEDPKILIRALRKQEVPADSGEVVWVIDGQGVSQLGQLLSRGVAPHKRLIALGGPGMRDPKHYSAYIGTPMRDVIPDHDSMNGTLFLRGGLLKGEEINIDRAAVQFDDDGFFALPEASKRQAVSFVRPGFDRTSAFPAFAGSMFGGTDRHMTASLRGEVRPCISCGMCEKICPVRLMPQVIHRYIYRDMPDEAMKAGLDSCIDCNLCTFICPSKIELQRQFAAAQMQILTERREAEQPE